MTWILPKQLHTSAYVPDTAALTLDSSELSQICEQSLFLRSKPSPARTWLAKWRRDSWTRLLSGRILRPSLGTAFTERYTSCLAAIRVSPFQQPDSAREQTTHAIFGPSLQMELEECGQSSVSLRTSKDTSALDSEKSLESWKASVIEQRGDYSRRLKLARLTSESGSSSWPTAAARDYKGTSPGYLFRADGKCRVDQLPVAVDQAEAGNWPTPTVQEAGKIGNQANHGQPGLSNHPALRGKVMREKFEKSRHGQVVPVSPSSLGSHPESLDKSNWATPQARDFRSAEGSKERFNDPNRSKNLNDQMKAWATPATRDTQGPRGKAAQARKGNPMDTLPNQLGARLNPRWVETLMGLSVGWTMPSCAAPATIAPTSSDCLGMALSQPQQSELFASSQGGFSNE